MNCCGKNTIPSFHSNCLINNISSGNRKCPLCATIITEAVAVSKQIDTREEVEEAVLNAHYEECRPALANSMMLMQIGDITMEGFIKNYCYIARFFDSNTRYRILEIFICRNSELPCKMNVNHFMEEALNLMAVCDIEHGELADIQHQPQIALHIPRQLARRRYVKEMCAIALTLFAVATAVLVQCYR